MSIKYWMALSLAAAFPVVVVAQDRSQQSDPSNPTEYVSEPSYQSAFKTYQPLMESTESSDKVWRAANDEVARVGGHMGAIKQESAPQSSKPASNGGSGLTPSGHGAHQKH